MAKKWSSLFSTKSEQFPLNSPGRPRVPREVLARAIILRGRGNSYRKIANELGISATTAFNAAQKLRDLDGPRN